MLKTEFVLSGEFRVNSYIVYDDTSKKAIVIDPGQDGKKVIDKIEKLKLIPELLINTHGHFDHTFSDDIIRQKYNIPLAIHENDTEMLSDANKNFSTIIGEPVTIKKADIVFMNIDGRVPDEGASVELGIAYGIGKRCYGFKTDTRAVEFGLEMNPMISGCMIEIFKNYDGDKLVEEIKQYLAKNKL